MKTEGKCRCGEWVYQNGLWGPVEKPKSIFGDLVYRREGFCVGCRQELADDGFAYEMVRAARVIAALEKTVRWIDLDSIHWPTFYEIFSQYLQEATANRAAEESETDE